jgi:hypothetical protein
VPGASFEVAAWLLKICRGAKELRGGGRCFAAHFHQILVLELLQMMRKRRTGIIQLLTNLTDDRTVPPKPGLVPMPESMSAYRVIC